VVPREAGQHGKPVPGHDVAVIDPDDGEPVDPGEVGEIAVQRNGDPVIFREYWNAPRRRPT